MNKEKGVLVVERCFWLLFAYVSGYIRSLSCFDSLQYGVVVGRKALSYIFPPGCVSTDEKPFLSVK